MSTASRTILSIFFVVALGSGIWFHWQVSSPTQGQDGSKGAGPVMSPSLATSSPGLTFSSLVHDFGALQESASFTFDFENQCEHTVRIASIAPSCRCTLVKPDKEVFKAGEKGQITVTVDPTSERPGRHAYSVTITYDGHSLEPTRLLLYAQHKLDVETPTEITIRPVGNRLGKVPFTIIDYRDSALEIKEILTSSPRLRVRVVEKPAVYLLGWKYVLEASFDGANLDAGDYAESIRLRTTDPERLVITLPVVVHKVRRIRVAPDTLYLKTDGSGSRIRSGIIYIDDTEDSLVEVVSVRPSHEGIQCTYTREPSARQRIEVRFNEAAKQEVKFPQEVRIVLGRPTREVITVKVYCKPSSALRP